MKGVFTFIDCTEYLISADCWGVAGANAKIELAGLKLRHNKRYIDMTFELKL